MIFIQLLFYAFMAGVILIVLFVLFMAMIGDTEHPVMVPASRSRKVNPDWPTPNAYELAKPATQAEVMRHTIIELGPRPAPRRPQAELDALRTAQIRDEERNNEQ